MEDHPVTVAGRSSPSNNAYSVADPRWASSEKWRHGQQYGVKGWGDTAHCIAGSQAPGQGAYAVADPRHGGEAKFTNCYRIVRWSETSPAVTGGTGPSAGGLALADPRPRNERQFDNIYRVTGWDQPTRTVIGRTQPSDGAMSVAGPRPGYGESTHSNVLRVTDWDAQAATVTGVHHPSGGAMCVADPRAVSTYEGEGKNRVTGWTDPSGTVIAASRRATAPSRWRIRKVRSGAPARLASSRGRGGTVAGESLPSNGTFAVADPRPGPHREKGDDYATAGHFGVIPWDSPTGALSSAACQDNGRWSVADPRLPLTTDRLVAIIRILDGTWHRPFTTFELAGLQSLVEPEEQLELDGLSDANWRERIGNAVPPVAAQAIASTMGQTLLLAWTGQGFMLSSIPI